MGLFKKEKIIIVADKETEDDIKIFAWGHLPWGEDPTVVSSGELLMYVFKTNVSRRRIIKRLKKFASSYRIKVDDNLIWVTKKQES